MSHKRKPSRSITGSSPHYKRSRASYTEDDHDDDENQRSVTPYEQPRNHPVFGQKNAFPGLDIDDGSGLCYGPAEDGLEYLRMVRSEANSLPLLFTAPPTAEPPAEISKLTGEEGNEKDKTQPQHDRQDEQSQAEPSAASRVREGVYSGGVYISLTATKPNIAEGYSDTQADYHNLLHHRFLLLRSILKCTPPADAIAALDDSHPISLPRRSKTAQKEWRRLLLTVDPQTVQLACMDMDSVLGVLGIMARLMSANVRSGDAVLVRRIGAWAWGLLGKCRDVGQLGTEEVGEIRDLGKRAVKILQKMKEEEEGDYQEDEDGYVSHEESDVDNAADNSGAAEKKDEQNITSDPVLDETDADNKADTEQQLERAKARLQAKILATEGEPLPQEEEEVQDENQREENEESGVDVSTQTHAMLDMIITVVGEHYGQRDLLEAREIWVRCSE